MIRIRGVNRTIGLFAAVLFFSTLVFAQGKAPAAKSSAVGSPVQVQVGIYPGDSLRALPREAATLIPIVIFGSATFNAAIVNPETISTNAPKAGLFGANGKSACHVEDPNKDGLPDLICTVQTNATRAKPGMAQVAVEGETTDGVRFRGEFAFQILPGPPPRPATAKH